MCVRSLHHLRERVIIRKRGAGRRIVPTGSEAGNGKKPRKPGRTRIPEAVWNTGRNLGRGQYAASTVSQSGLF